MPDPTTTTQIAKLAGRGNTEREIATLTGVPKTTIHETLQKLKHDPDYITFCNDKSTALEVLQYQIANAVDHADIKTMLSKRGLTDLAILEDKIRLIRGQATSISAVDIRALIDSIPVDNPVDIADPNDIA